MAFQSWKNYSVIVIKKLENISQSGNLKEYSEIIKSQSNSSF